MTIQGTTNKILYTGDGVTTVFAYNFRVDRAEDMAVYIAGVLTPTGWSISGLGNNSGGNVTFSVAPDDGDSVSLLREIAMEQLVDYKPYDPFPANVHEHALDKLTMISQQLQEEINRAIVGNPDTPADVDTTLPIYDAGKGIMWDEVDKKMTVSTDNFNDIVTDAAASAAAALVSESAALVSEDKAHQWAEEAEDVEVETGEFSSYHWALKAADWAVGVPSGTRMIFQQAAVLLGWTLQNIGDCVLGVSNGTDKLYDGENPGALNAGSFVNGGLGVTIAGVTLSYAWYTKSAGIGRSYNSSGSITSFNTAGGTSGTDLVMHVSGGDGYKTSQTAMYTAKVTHGHTGSVVTDNGSGRPLAAVCHVAEKD